MLLPYAISLKTMQYRKIMLYSIILIFQLSCSEGDNEKIALCVEQAEIYCFIHQGGKRSPAAAHSSGPEPGRLRLQPWKRCAESHALSLSDLHRLKRASNHHQRLRGCGHASGERQCECERQPDRACEHEQCE